ncbi:MAG: hypothetical protein KatS3mg053_2289 [Candidatus Roseilinea sp.]|nr:MAG: hypothetical protein KatS3mg053_2289 [Candidatus Roseilinea sp.]
MSLTPQQIATLNAAADRIIPPDDESPGAVASGAATRLLAMLEGDLAALQRDYAAFLTQLDLEAQVAFGASFAELDAERQDALLGTFQSSAFFRLFAEHVHEQFWSSEAGMTLVGFEVRG